MKAFAGVALITLSCGGREATTAPVRIAPPALASSPASLPVHSPGLHFDVRAVDPHADPCVDFYRYACGGWRATHPIPSDESRWDRYAEIIARNQARERSIIDEAVHVGTSGSPAERRVGAYEAACMDDAAIEAHGLEPIRDLLATIEAIRSPRAAADAIADFQLHGLDATFAVFIQNAPHDAAKPMVWFEKGSLGMRDPAAYTKKDDASASLRTHYREHLVRLFGLLGDSADKAAAAAEHVIQFETSLSEKALSAVERRNAANRDHTMTVAELGKRYRSIDWQVYFAKLGLASVDQVNVAQTAWLDAVSTALAARDLEGLRQYLRFLLVRTQSTALPRAIDAEVFDFRGRTLRGAKDLPPRWKRCVELVDRDVGDDVGRIFVARYFSDAARARMGKMVAALVSSYRADIERSDWLGDAATKAALTKLDKMLIVVGASNRPRSYDGLRIDANDPFGDGWRAQEWETRRELSTLGKPVDREEFFEDLPQELDGFGSKTMNATGFTAGFLQPPVFDLEMDDAVNFGGLGSVIGHELTHHFDDEGRKYDVDGAIEPWWAPDDVAHFEERAQCFVDEYSRFAIDDGTKVDGKLTLGENLADNGGIRLSYAALRPSDDGPKIDGYTPAQRFFLAWGQIRCENVTPEAAHRQVESNEHAPGIARVNGVVSNMPEFAHAFGCAAGAPMAPTKRCTLW